MLTPTHDLIFVEKIEEEVQDSGLIVITDEKEPRGQVVAVGPGKTYSTGEVVPCEVQVGDKVIYSKHAGQTFNFDGKSLIALREVDIYAVI